MDLCNTRGSQAVVYREGNTLLKSRLNKEIFIALFRCPYYRIGRPTKVVGLLRIWKDDLHNLHIGGNFAEVIYSAPLQPLVEKFEKNICNFLTSCYHCSVFNIKAFSFISLLNESIYRSLRWLMVPTVGLIMPYCLLFVAFYNRVIMQLAIGI